MHVLNVARNGDMRGDLRLAVEHANDLAELYIFDDLERAMATRDPHHNEVAHAARRVLHAARVRRNHLRFRSLLRVARLDVPGQVPGGLLVFHPVHMLRRVPVKMVRRLKEPDETDNTNFLQVNR